MDMSGEQRIEASPEAVWTGLNDPEVLKQCITGCDTLLSTGENAFEAVVTAKIGPVKATFKGAVELSEIDRPNSYVISGEGKGGPAGFAKGSARVALKADGAATILNYTVEAKVGGKLAQIGSKLVDMAVKKMAEDFFAKFCEIVGPQAEDSNAASSPETTEVSTSAKKPTSSGIPIWGWLIGAAICGALVWAVIK